MKILRLQLCNLASLRDTTAVDFSLPPLANSGLFAITGPTGAGKSTLLDAITLALYGRVARYGSTPSPEAVMSRHTGECSAEIEFSCSAGTFRSVWQLQRARKKPDGKIQAAKRRVIALPAETVIAESTRDADAKILELTGLDYERFLRSVLLAQGDFAAFLKAGPKERTELLQQVTGTAIYQDISQAAFRRSADAEAAHAELLRSHQAVAVLGAGDRARQEANVAAHRERAAGLTLRLQEISRRLAEAERWSEIERGTQQLQADQAAHLASLTAAAADLVRLEQHERAVPFLSDLTTLDRLEADLTKDQSAARELENRIPELDRSVTLAEQAVKTTQSTLAQEIERQQGLRAVWAEVTALDQTLAASREARRQIDEQQRALQKATAVQRTSLDQATVQLQQASAAHAAALRWLSEHVLDGQVSADLPEIQTAFARYSAIADTRRQAQTGLLKLTQEAERLEASVRELQAVRLPPLERELGTRAAAVLAAKQVFEAVSENFSPAELDARRDQARERRAALEQLAAEATRLRALRSELTRGENEIQQTAQNLGKAEEARQRVQQRQTELTALLNAHRTTLLFAEKVQSLESHRAELRADTPCPLCGALQHPYSTSALVESHDLARFRHDVETTTKGLSAVQRDATEAEKRCASLLADHRRLTTQVLKMGEEHSVRESAWNAHATPHGLTKQFATEAPLLTALGAAAADERQRQTQIVSVRVAQQALEAAKQQHHAAQTICDEHKHEAAKQAALAAQTRGQVAAASNSGREQEQQVNRDRAALSQIIAGFTDLPRECEDLSPIIAGLKQRAAEFTRQTTEMHRLLAEVNTHQAKTEALALQLATTVAAERDLQLKLTTATDDLVRIERLRFDRFGERVVAEAQSEAEKVLTQARQVAEEAHAALVQHRQIQASARQERDRLTEAITTRAKERQVITHRLLAGATQAGFADLPELRAVLLNVADAARLNLRRKILEDRRITLAAQTASLAAQRASLADTASADAAQKEALRTEQAAADTERGALQAALGEIRAVLKNDDEQRVRQQAYATQIEAAHREFVRWNRLRELIGSADGSVFARFAQGLTLERLSVLANLHLGQLNARYSIRRVADGEAGDLELEIVDHYQADVARPMRSLSGGESFLVSLALALGLSELASGRTTIESVFIDEGFGSLDADTLETAMSALESLHARGKTIGVISHVPAMQERIPAQIRVAKEAGGCSRVTIVA